MIPQAAVEFEAETALSQTSRTYRADFEGGRISGYTDGLKAMEQAVYLILNTERFRHLIFSWDYGSELHTVIGKDIQLARSEAKRLITEALTQDERITDVTDFEFSQNGRNTLAVRFTVNTVFGALESEVQI